MKQQLQWLGLFLMACLVLSCGPVDPRYDLFEQDADKMEGESLTSRNDTLAEELETIFEATVNPKLKPEDFKYYTRISDDGQRLLVLMQMPKLKKVEESERTEVVGMVQTWHELNPAVKDKKLYLGVKGNFTWMITKAPGQEADNSLVASKSDLYDFYGPREQFEKGEGK